MSNNSSLETYSLRPTHQQRRRVTSRVVFALACILSLATAIPLLAILIELITKGWHQLNLDFFTRVVPSSIEAMLAKQSGQPVSYTHLTLPTKRIV